MGPCAWLTSAAVMSHAIFHQASPFVPCVIFFAKYLLHVAFVSSRRSSLAHMREVTSVIRGRGKRANEAIHSGFIMSSIFQPISDGGGIRGISRGRSTNRAA